MSKDTITASEMGRRGHLTRLAKYGSDYYRKIGANGLRKRWGRKKNSDPFTRMLGNKKKGG